MSVSPTHLPVFWEDLPLLREEGVRHDGLHPGELERERLVKGLGGLCEELEGLELLQPGCDHVFCDLVLALGFRPEG